MARIVDMQKLFLMTASF